MNRRLHGTGAESCSFSDLLAEMGQAEVNQLYGGLAEGEEQRPREGPERGRRNPWAAA
jgi:hypothetical protein